MENFILSLRSQYREMVPISIVLAQTKDWIGASGSKNHEEFCSLEFQQRMVDVVLHDRISERFPVSKKYRKKFLAIFINFYETHRAEIEEELMSMYVELLDVEENSNSKEICFKSYQVDVSKLKKVAGKIPQNSEHSFMIDLLAIRHSTMFNLVGLTTWEAGFYLAEFFLEHSELLDQKNCLELGAGVGLTSLAIAKWQTPKRLVVTDHTDAVIDNLKHNFDINDVRTENLTSKIDIEELDWKLETKESILKKFSEIDVVFAADVVYDPELLVLMLQNLKWVLQSSSSRNPTSFIATTIRNKDTFDFFQSNIEKAGLKVHAKHSTDFKLFRYPRSNIIIQEIHLA